jgi:biotin carboxyl carrier protein
MVKVDKQLFEVEISDLNSRPIIAVVDGEAIEVWPESGDKETLPAAVIASASKTIFASPVNTRVPTAGNVNPSVLRAPIPGNILAVYVKPGDQIVIGQELCVLEAMKMHNAIRSGRAGHVANVHITVGTTVKHNDLLFEFAD